MATTTTKPLPVEHTNGGATAIEAIETNVKAVEDAAVKTADTRFVWLRRLPLAGLGLVATMYDETEVFVNKLFMSKLVKRGEQVQKNAEKWLKDVQAHFH
jgi:hypothetical protein